MTQRRSQKKQQNPKTSQKKQAFWLLLLVLIVVVFIAIQPNAPTTAPNTPTLTPEAPSHPPIEPEGTLTYSSLHIPQYTSKQPEQIAEHTGYTVSFNSKHQIPNWVSYELTREETQGTAKRSGRFIPDPTIRSCKVCTSDYSHSGYDRGHMAPAVDMKWNKRAMQETFFLSNICPQHPDLNKKSWKDLEDKVREWAIRDSAIIVICGPLTDKSNETIGQSKVKVPSGFFKIILSPFQEKPQAIGFLYQNKKSTDPLKTYAVPVDSIEKLTGMDFFSELPDAIENTIEAEFDLWYWDL